MTKPSPRAPTLGDLDALPPGTVGEIINGVLYTMTKPRAWHQRTRSAISGVLRRAFDDGPNGPGGWWIVGGPGIEMPNALEFSPDVAGWRRERMPKLPDDEPVRVVPDWVCEILSKITRHHVQIVKVPYYAEIGVAYAWLVDLEARVVTARRLESRHWVAIGTYSTETEARIAPFDAVPLNLADWWPPAPVDQDAGDPCGRPR